MLLQKSPGLVPGPYYQKCLSRTMRTNMSYQQNQMLRYETNSFFKSHRPSASPRSLASLRCADLSRSVNPAAAGLLYAAYVIQLAIGASSCRPMVGSCC